MTTKIQQYEQAIQQEIKNKEILSELEKNAEMEYQSFLNRIAEKINKFLESNGSDERYDVTSSEGYERFAVRVFGEGSKMLEEFFEFVDYEFSRYQRTIEIPHELYHSSLTDFVELNIPLDLKREDFTSDEHYKIYKGHVRTILSDRD